MPSGNWLHEDGYAAIKSRRDHNDRRREGQELATAEKGEQTTQHSQEYPQCHGAKDTGVTGRIVRS